MTLSIPPDDDLDTGQKFCAGCTNMPYCANVRWTQRPCEQQPDRDDLSHQRSEPAPWQRARVEETDPAHFAAHKPWCESRYGLIFRPERCTCGLVPAKVPTPPPSPVPSPPSTRDAASFTGDPKITDLPKIEPEICHNCGHDRNFHEALRESCHFHSCGCKTYREKPSVFRETISAQINAVAREALRSENARLLREGSDKLNELHAFTSGAKSSEHLVRYDLIPWHIFAERLAKRYTDGAAKYGEYNWQKGLTEREYVLDRANHTLRHLHRAVELMRSWSFGSSEPLSSVDWTRYDDDLAAAMWGIIFLMAAQRDHGAEL